MQAPMGRPRRICASVRSLQHRRILWLRPPAMPRAPPARLLRVGGHCGGAPSAEPQRRSPRSSGGDAAARRFRSERRCRAGLLKPNP